MRPSVTDLQAGFKLLAILSIVCCGAAANADPIVYYDHLFGVKVTRDVQYGSGIANGASIPLLADIYEPIGIGLADVPDDRPAIVIQDGGAWTSASRSRERVTIPAVYSAQRGYTVVVTDYRQGAPGLPFGIADPGPHAPVTVGQTKFGTAPYAGISAGSIYSFYPGINPIRAGIEDFALAIDWTRTNAAALNINPDKIAVAGGSAGGIDALLLQYNNNNVDNNGLRTVDPRYAAQAVIALVSTMDGNHDRIRAGGPPVFLLNNTADVVVPWSEAMSQRFADLGIYREQWFQATSATAHGVDWGEIVTNQAGEQGIVLELMRDFLYTQLVAVPEPASLVMGAVALAAFLLQALRRPLAARRERSA